METIAVPRTTTNGDTTKVTEPNINENAYKVLKARYFIKNEQGEVVETPSQLMHRVSYAIAESEATEQDRGVYGALFKQMLSKLDFLPNTPCLVNAGRPGGTGQYSACFVIPVPDSMEGIFEAVKQMALVHKTGGGTGFSFSRLRRKGAMVKTTSGIASGPISFMAPFNATTETTKQGGVRRGANMGILRVDHPDIMEFIRLKANDVNALQNFNVSVAITTRFMEALERDETYDLVDPTTKEVVGQLSAKEVMNEIVRCAWTIGDPGLFFIDRANELDPLTEVLGEIEATNPCGEVPLRAHDACTLGSINLSNFFEPEVVTGDGHDHKRKAGINYERLRKTVKLAVRFLDNVLTANRYPVKEIHEVTAASRKIGLGVMGWAELLIKLELPYASQEAYDLASSLMSFISREAIAASEELATERGPFPAFAKSKHRSGRPRRNSTCTVIAPTGTISIIAGCSSGIEPLYALGMTRQQAGMEMVEINPLLEVVAKKHGFWSDELAAHVAKTGSVQQAPGVPERWKQILMIANEIPVEAHIAHQAAFQRYVEDGVSKTINMRREATQDDVRAAYMLAYSSGCKGITVYRDGSRDGQVLTTGTQQAQPVSSMVSAPLHPRRVIPKDGYRTGVTITRPTAYGSIHVTVNEHPDDGEPFEVFVRIGKGGSEVNAWTEAFGRSASYLFSLPSPTTPTERVEMLIDQLSGIGGGESIGLGPDRISSAADAIANVLRAYLTRRNINHVSAVRFDFCPQCHQATLSFEQKCGLCKNCGYSKC